MYKRQQRDLPFFPTDNTKGAAGDPALRALRAAAERVKIAESALAGAARRIAALQQKGGGG